MKLNEKFRKVKKLGSGSFSKVYKAKDLSNKSLLALKVSRVEHMKLLYNEKNILEEFALDPSFAKLKYFEVGAKKCVLGMTLLGETLNSLCFEKNIMPDKVLFYVIQVLDAIENFHKKGYIHRDIKPDNICIGRKDKNTTFLIDFGISEKYWDFVQNKHNPRSLKREFKGNVAFCSDSALLGINPSRRDDLEALCYVAIYLVKKTLPWIECSNISEVTCIRGSSSKALIKNLPIEMIHLINYCKLLRYEEDPDYGYIKKQFEECRNAYNSLLYAEIFVINEKVTKPPKKKKFLLSTY